MEISPFVRCTQPGMFIFILHKATKLKPLRSFFECKKPRPKIAEKCCRVVKHSMRCAPTPFKPLVPLRAGSSKICTSQSFWSVSHMTQTNRVAVVLHSAGLHRLALRSCRLARRSSKRSRLASTRRTSTRRRCLMLRCCLNGFVWNPRSG